MAREMLQQWFEEYPKEHRLALRQRLRSNDDRHHLAAVLELMLHALALRLGYQVSVHPEKGGKRPDFLLRAPHGAEVYLESALVTDESDEDYARRRRTNRVYDALNDLASPAHWLLVIVDGWGREELSARRLKDYVSTRLAALPQDPTTAGPGTSPSYDEPTWTYDDRGWRLRLWAIPKSPAERSQAGVRPLAGMLEGTAFRVQTEESIRTTLRKKARRYGNMDRPYIVAVGVPVHAHDDVLGALFGSVVVEVAFRDGQVLSQRPRLAPNGLWSGPNGPRLTSVSAVLVIERVSLWDLAKADWLLYHNPWATKPCTAALPAISSWSISDQGVCETAGIKPAAILSCPAS